ncbi:MAG TPA: DUF1287 domain-containing protein [Rhizomicrobium sp.]|jgi:hypothetical protein|nr:DUF1287 domain-containing protein [Rhizomicrobium sp.]
MAKRPFCLVLAVAVFAAPAMAKTIPAANFLQAAAKLENPAVTFDSGYHRIAYPRGDVPANTGVCADVVVRAYRGIGIDLQQRVHEDMTRNFALYPKQWGLHHPDSNVDHRRVLNLATFFRRQGAALNVTFDPRDYKPGDLVTWNLNPKGSTPHIGIVMAQRSWDGSRPLILHNMGEGQIVQDVLFAYTITGHFRYAID